MQPSKIKLPSLTYVPFEARKLNGAALILNRDSKYCHDQEILTQYAWMHSINNDDLNFMADDPATFHAERYGGIGIGIHGGGARCGIASNGDYLIKGIGCTPLLGREAPLDYSHGGVSLFEAIKEAVWGEVLYHALPYRAARAPYVIATGTRCWWVVNRWGEDLLRDRYGVDVYLPRGLIVREAAIRPAHFERAMFFEPASELLGEIASDVERVRANIQILHQALPLSADISPESILSPAERLHSGMSEMARRFAMQEAAATAKRLIHGNISPSNICLDGRWLDFGSFTALPGWGDVMGYGAFWDNSGAYANIFSGLCFNIRKYFTVKNDPLPQEGALLAEYQATYTSLLQKRFLSLTGWPFVLLDEVQRLPAVDRLYRILLAIAKAGHSLPYREPYKEQPDDESEFGTYRLGAILSVLARSNGLHDCDARVAPLLHDAWLRRDLMGAYIEAFQSISAVADRHGVSPTGLRRLTLINSAKTARSIRLLYVAHLVRECERIVLTHRDMKELRNVVEAFVESLVNESRIVYGDHATLTTTMWIRDGECLTYSARTNKFYIEADSDQIETAGREINITRSTLPIIEQARAFFGVELWEHLQ
ncbi:hypothetical protein [Metallibacterium scheffleri]